MNSEIRKLLESVQAGKTSVDDAMLELKKAPFEDIGYAKVDLHRKVRQGAAEVIYGAGKTPEQIGGIIDAMLANDQTRVLITRMSPEAAAYVGQSRELDYHKDARVGIVGGLPRPDGIGKVVIATGGFGGAGIGGANIKNSGALEITGGTITATGKQDAHRRGLPCRKWYQVRSKFSLSVTPFLVYDDSHIKFFHAVVRL